MADPEVLINPTPQELEQLPPGVYAVATVVHPDREYTAEEKAHLGIADGD